MNGERWTEVERLYHAVLDRGPVDRARLLAEADADLRAEVESLLGCESQAGDFLETPALEVTAQALAAGRTRSMLGRRLGPYEILAFIGAGGMGEVYRAHDSRIGRDVAIKLLPAGIAGRPERVLRFEQEARAAGALNHPNILNIYDVGVEDGAPYVVSELLEGQTLRAILRKGALARRKALEYGRQIALGLAAAHHNGVVHQDIKPENIFVTRDGRVKILDFGLAKLRSREAAAAAAASSSSSGGIPGTPAYMAPEQFRGQPVDHRADLFNLGVVLCEMLTGQKPFAGDSTPELREAILHHDPLEGLEVQAAFDPPLGRVLRRCLEKNPDERIQSALDLAFDLDGLLLPYEKEERTSWTMPAAVALLALLLAALSFLHFRERPADQQSSRVSIVLPEKARALSVALSPDGRAIAMVLVKEGKQQIWVRALDALEPTPLGGTDGAADPFWSPDSRYIGFFADARLKKIERSGGPVQTLCDALGARGGAWNRAGDIVFGALFQVQRVSASGGPTADLPGPSPGADIYPVFLPDGRHYLATRGVAAGAPDAGIWLSSMDNGGTRRIVPDASNAQVLEPPPGSRVGHVLFVRDGALLALPFDMKRLEPAGDAFPVARGIAEYIAPYWIAAASNQGTLVYLSGRSGVRQYVWRDRQGRTLGVIPGAGAVVQVSPDGKRLLGDRSSDLWLLEFATGVATRLTFGPLGNINPIWSPDGRYVAYTKGGRGLCRKPADGAGAEEVLVPSPRLVAPKSWSPDHRYILYMDLNAATGADLFAVPAAGGTPFPVVQTPANEDQGQFSPDGHWVAYTSNASGESEIYVMPFPPPSDGRKWQVSRGGGVQPRWNKNGRELFYIAPDSRMMSVEVRAQPAFESATPRPLFQTELFDNGIRTGPLSWDLAPDGDRFLIISDNAAETPALTVELNWRAPQKGRE